MSASDMTNICTPMATSPHTPMIPRTRFKIPKTVIEAGLTLGGVSVGVGEVDWYGLGRFPKSLLLMGCSSGQNVKAAKQTSILRGASPHYAAFVKRTLARTTRRS